MKARTCPRGFGRYGVCGAVLEADTVNGRLVVWCPKCVRTARGICCDCPARVDGAIGKARRCASCRAKANAESLRRYAVRERRTLNTKARMYARRPDVRAARNDYKRLWRKKNPDKVAAQKRRSNLRGVGRLASQRRRAKVRAA